MISSLLLAAVLAQEPAAAPPADAAAPETQPAPAPLALPPTASAPAPAPAVHLTVAGEVSLAGFPELQENGLGYGGGIADYSALHVGLELPLGPLRVTPELGAGLSGLVGTTGYLDAFGGVRL